MAKTTFSNQNTDFLIKYRAVCEDDNFKGTWRDNIETAKADARSHRSQAGNQNHVIRIVAQQTLTMTFDE
jgi:hypothetical protein